MQKDKIQKVNGVYVCFLASPSEIPVLYKRIKGLSVAGQPSSRFILLDTEPAFVAFQLGKL